MSRMACHSLFSSALLQLTRITSTQATSQALAPAMGDPRQNLLSF